MVGQGNRQHSAGNNRSWENRGRFNRFGNDSSMKKNDSQIDSKNQNFNKPSIQSPSSADNKSKQQGATSGDHGNKGQRNYNRHDREKNIQSNRQGGRDNQSQNTRSNSKTNSNIKEEETDATSSDEPKKFTGRCRLFLGNLPNDVSEEEFKKLFTEHGEVSEVYLNNLRGFGFVRMDTRQNAEAAKCCLDGKNLRGRVLRVRFATHGAAIRIKYLPPTCSNELLVQAFSIFGNVERAVVIVDDRGKPTGEGIVEFARKPGAVQALKRVTEGVFTLGTHPRPVAVEPLEQKDEEDGVPEKFISKTSQFHQERQQEPKFASPGSFEYSFGQKWKELYMVEEQQKEELKKQMDDAVHKLEMDMESALQEHTLMSHRQDLMRKQEELRIMEERFAMEQDRKMRRQGNMQQQQQHSNQGMMEEQRRQEELFAQQQRAMREMGREHGAPPMPPPPAPPAGLALERPRRDGNMGMDPNMMNNGQQNMGGDQGMRRSRFDQGVPQNVQGFQQGMGGGPGSQGSMQGGPQGGGNRPQNRDHGPPPPRGPPPPPPPPSSEEQGEGLRENQQRMDQRMMEHNRDHQRDEYYDNKRPRRY